MEKEKSMRGGSSKTRIETALPVANAFRPFGMRGGSSKTRIETRYYYRIHLTPSSMRGGSSKTRIETKLMIFNLFNAVWYERRFQ